MSHNTIEMCKSYYENPQFTLTLKIYTILIKTMECQHCNKEFKTSRDRCLDHIHETGAFL